MESKLHKVFLQLRKEGKVQSVGGCSQAVLVNLSKNSIQMKQATSSILIDGSNVSAKRKRHKTHTSQKAPADLRKPIENFHVKLLRERTRGTYKLADLANMDLTPLPFVLEDNRT